MDDAVAGSVVCDESDDEVAGPSGVEAEEELLIGLVKAIEELESELDDPEAILRQLKRLSRDDIRRLIRMKVPGANGGKLTVLGHLCVKKTCFGHCSKDLMDFLLTEENVNNLEEFDGHRIPLLNLAVYCGNEGAVHLMCPEISSSASLGAHIFASASTKLNALHMAVKSQEKEALLRLLFVTLRRKRTEMQTGFANEKDDLGMTPLHYAAWEDNKDATEGLLGHWGSFEFLQEIYVNATQRNGFTALHLAALNNGIEVLDALLEHQEIDVNATDHNGFTALHVASWNNHSECVRILLRHPLINRNATDEHGRTASYLASRNHIEAMYRLLRRIIPNLDIKLNDATDDENSFTVEHLALWKQQKRIIEAMLVGSQDVDVPLPQISRQMSEGAYVPPGESMKESLRSDFENLESHLLQFSPGRKRWLETTKNNWQRRAETNEFLTPDSSSALHENERPGPGREMVIDDRPDEEQLTVLVEVIIRALNQRVDQVRVIDRLKWLSENNWLSDQDIMRLSRLRVRDNVGGGMLSVLGHLCVRKSDSALVLEFLLSEASVNILEEFDNHSIPLLHLAAYCGNDAAVKVLCNVKGINLSVRSSSNLNVLHIAAKSGNSRVVDEIGVCASRLSCDMVRDLVNGQDDLGMTPLHHAAWEGNLSVMRSLICMNMINVNAIACNGLTPLHLASWNNQMLCVDNLCSHPAINMNITDKNGFTALHLASWNNHSGCVEYLLINQGIDVCKTDEHGFTALDLASRNHIEAMFRLLHHPNVNLIDTNEHSFAPLYLANWKWHKKNLLDRMSWWARRQAGSWLENSDVSLGRTFVGTYATLGESARKSLEEKFERMESHLFQFCSDRGETVRRMKDRVWDVDICSQIDWQKAPAETEVARGNLADEQLLMELMEDIIALKPGADDASVIDRLVWFSENNWLSKNDIITLSHIRVPDLNEGRLSVLGHLCVRRPCSELVLRFLLRAADGNTEEKFGDHRIPLLHLAVYFRNYAAVDVLTDNRTINLLARSSSKLNALHVAVKSRDTSLARSVYNALLAAIKSDAWFVGVKTYLVSVGDESASVIESMIISDLVNGQDDFGMTPLHYAVWEGDERMTDLLLSMKTIKVNATDNDGLTPLHLASWNNQHEVLKKLLVSPNVDIALQSRVFMSKAFDWQSERDCLQKDTFKIIESHLLQFVFDPRKLGENLSRAMLDELQENDRADGWGYARQLRGDENRREIADFLWPSSNDHDNDDHVSNGCMTALHCAAWRGHSTIVVELMHIISKLPRARTMSNLVDKYGLSPMHYAIMRGDAGMVDELLSYSLVVKGNIREHSIHALTPLSMAYRLIEHFEGLGDKIETVGEHRHRKATVDKYKIIVGLLEELSDVKAYIETLYKERQLFIDAANAILVGAALIASISFAGWLQPPLGYQQYYESGYLLTGSAPPDTYASFASVKQHISVTMFWVFNSLSFFFAVGTVVTGACVVLPMREKAELEKHVRRMRWLHIWTTLFLCSSVVFVLGAFIAAGFASLPTELEYQWVMISTTGVGGSVAICALFYYVHRVFILIKWILRPTFKGRTLKQFLLCLFAKYFLTSCLEVLALLADGTLEQMPYL